MVPRLTPLLSDLPLNLNVLISHPPHTMKIQQAGQDTHGGHAGSSVGVTGTRGDESNQRAKLPQLQGDLRDRRLQGSHPVSTHIHT